MAAFQKLQQFVEDLALGVHNFNEVGGHTLKVALTNTEPVATNTVLANITQISGTNGYTTGGTPGRSRCIWSIGGDLQAGAQRRDVHRLGGASARSAMWCSTTTPPTTRRPADRLVRLRHRVDHHRRQQLHRRFRRHEWRADDRLSYEPKRQLHQNPVAFRRHRRGDLLPGRRPGRLTLSPSSATPRSIRRNPSSAAQACCSTGQATF